MRGGVWFHESTAMTTTAIGCLHLARPEGCADLAESVQRRGEMFGRVSAAVVVFCAVGIDVVCEDILQVLDKRPSPRMRLAVVGYEEESTGDGSLDTDPGPRAVGVNGVQLDERFDCPDEVRDAVFADHGAAMVVGVGVWLESNPA